jgi:hypothetical protein
MQSEESPKAFQEQRMYSAKLKKCGFKLPQVYGKNWWRQKLPTLRLEPSFACSAWVSGFLKTACGRKSTWRT